MSENIVSLDPALCLVSKLNTRQPKREEVAELALSMKTTGQISPIIVRPHPTKTGSYEIAAGARRNTACRLNKTPVDAIIREIPDDEFEDMILTDNLQREDPDPAQEALLIQRRLKDGASIPEIAARYGKTENWVRRRIKLLNIIPELQEQLNDKLSHYSTVMREFLGELAPDAQIDFAEDYCASDIKSLPELRAHLKDRECDLSKAAWLDDPATFVPGCGPGCAHSSANSLFKEENDCGTCLNGACFRKRRNLAIDAAIDAVIGTHDPKTVIFFSKTYKSEFGYHGNTIKLLYGWEFDQKYKVRKKAADAIGLDVTDIAAPKLVHLAKVASKSKATASTANPSADPRVDRVLGKRTAHVIEALKTYLTDSTWEEVKKVLADEFHLLSLCNAFGGAHNASYRSTRDWHTYDDTDTSSACEDLWDRLKTVFIQRLGYGTLGETISESYSYELGRIAALVDFDLDVANANAAAAVSPKWITKEGYDNATLTKNP